MPNYQKTKRACYMGFITQAIAANFAPLLFLKFHTDYHISLGNIALISTCFFFTQLLVDLFCARFVDKIGYRVCIVTSEISSALGLVGLAFLPELLPDPFMGIIISVIVYAVGSGLIEVLCSPIMEACPFKNKEATMSLLHSFYCWGHVAVVLLSTLFFLIFGIGYWKILALLWAVVPAVNLIAFTKVPLYPLAPRDGGFAEKPVGRNGTSGPESTWENKARGGNDPQEETKGRSRSARRTRGEAGERRRGRAKRGGGPRRLH